MNDETPDFVILPNGRLEPERAPIYRFCQRGHRDAFFTTGSLRLGTVHGYRDTLTLDAARADSLEGIRKTRREIDRLEMRPGEYHPVASEMFVPVGPEPLTIRNVNLVHHIESPDLYTLCAAKAFSEEMFLRWNKIDRKTDACYEITAPIRLLLSVAIRYPQAIRESQLGYVSYADPPLDWRSPLFQQHPALLKRTEYEWQEEVRFLFDPRKPPLPVNGWMITVPQAALYCRRFARIKTGRVVYE